ncbi:flagellar motor switch protein FliG [Ohessyouella blattaphilus]|uniref:Flagellar motor switch protein FliG n=1 Tax=Ohessyouella blattaphilus TaxID=2949333 RepID=A0ABT1EF33_9FIRM|nr:flagellar motor switch protein FliG [Ohessyouella blattaphilus]MCP1109116.1 flagellar motor switch protein FliG [Ohessyouella blattaphilus]MCR8562510.1 flagellar motor switch protein FliG [Ohessyouella blattaphilus]
MEATRQSRQDKLNIGQKAAAVIAALGAEKASKVYKYLNEDEVEKLTLEVARLGHVEAEQTEKVLDDFYKTCLTQKVVTDGGMEYARAVLEKAYGESVAQELLKKVGKHMKGRSFDFIKRGDTKNLISFLQHERPQTIALVLSYVDPNQAAELISNLSDEKRLKVVESIARMESASPEVIKLVEKELAKKFDSILTTDFMTIGGIDYIAGVMNHMDRSSEKAIFDAMSQEDPDLAETIRKKMFVFEDILGMDNRSIQRFIRECDMKDVVYALKNASQEMLGIFFANMSSRMSETIQSDLEVTVNVKLRDVEEAQQRIVAIIRKLDEEGELVLGKGGKDDIIA